MILQDAIEKLHAVEFDFLRGDEEYKYFWTKAERKTSTVLYWGKTARALAGRAEFVARRTLSPLRRGGQSSAILPGRSTGRSSSDE